MRKTLSYLFALLLLLGAVFAPQVAQAAQPQPPAAQSAQASQMLPLSTKGLANERRTYVRPNPNTKDKPLARVARDTSFKVLGYLVPKGYAHGFFQVEWEGTTAYVSGNQLNVAFGPALDGTVAKDGYAYSQRSTRKKHRAFAVEDGTAVKLLTRQGKWWQAEVGGQTAFIPASLVGRISLSPEAVNPQNGKPNANTPPRFGGGVTWDDMRRDVYSLTLQWQASGAVIGTTGTQSTTPWSGAAMIGPFNNGVGSAIITLNNLAAHDLLVGGPDIANVALSGTNGTANRTLTVDTNSIKAAGGTKVFTLTLSEGRRVNSVYTITVTVAAPTYAVTMTNDGNGTAIATPANAAQGARVTLSATPKANYAFKEWEIVSGTVTLSSATTNPATFTMPAGAVSIKAKFTASAGQSAADTEAAKIAGFTATANAAASLKFNATGFAGLASGAVVNLVSVKAGADEAGAVSLGSTTMTTGVLSVGTAVAVNAADLTYVGVTFTVTLNGVTSASITRDVSALFGATTTVGKLRADKAKFVGTLTANGWGTTPGAQPLKAGGSGITLSAGVSIASKAAASAADTSLSSDLNKVTISAAAGAAVNITTAGVYPSTSDVATFDGVTLTCDATSYALPTLSVTLAP